MIPVVTTAEMLAAAIEELPQADGVIAAAAPCDFEPVRPVRGKIPRNAGGLSLKLRATTDVIATLAARIKRQPSGRRRATWCVAFALEPGADKARACAKVTAKQCDLIVVNDLAALESTKNAVAVYDAHHALVGEKRGTKPAVATWLIQLIEKRLMGG